jgi:hypothetical protein
MFQSDAVRLQSSAQQALQIAAHGTMYLWQTLQPQPSLHCTTATITQGFCKKKQICTVRKQFQR